LNDNNMNSTLVLIGVVEDYTVLNEIKAYADENVIFLNDDLFTVNAAELIDVADFVIGTGNNIMEAAAISKVLLTPSKGSDLPILIDEKNFEEVLKFNFELRFPIQDYNEEENYKKIGSIINNKNNFEEYRKFSYLLFDKYFNIENRIDKYVEIYSGLKYRKIGRLTDYFMHFYIISKAFLLGRT